MESLYDYFDTGYLNLVQFKRASICTSYLSDTTLEQCSCGYFKKYNLPCSHMYSLALEKGVFVTKLNSPDCVLIISKLNSLSNMCFRKFADAMYAGYYYDAHKTSSLDRYYGKILQSGLICENEDSPSYVYSDLVLDNIFFVLNYVFTDPRYKK